MIRTLHYLHTIIIACDLAEAAKIRTQTNIENTLPACIAPATAEGRSMRGMLHMKECIAHDVLIAYIIVNSIQIGLMMQ